MVADATGERVWCVETGEMEAEAGEEDEGGSAGAEELVRPLTVEVVTTGGAALEGGEADSMERGDGDA